MDKNQFPKLSDFSPEGLVVMADEHDDEAFACAMGQHPAMVKEPGFYEIITGVKHPYANMAFGMLVPDAQDRVRQITAKVRAANCPAFFWVGPCTKPKNLEDILVQEGWEHLGSPPAMVIDIEAMSHPPLPDKFALKRVTTELDLKLWREMICAGFNLPFEVAEMFAPNGDSMHLYTAFLGDEPVGTTARFDHNGVTGIYCVSTIPEFRGLGVGAALTSVPLLEAYDEGFRVGTLQASSMGLPIYQKLGFFEVCRLKMYGIGHK